MLRLRERYTSASVSLVPTRQLPSVTLALHQDGWNAITKRAGMTTEQEQAAALHISRQTVWRVRNKKASPGPEFIAAALRAFPEARFEQMFVVVSKAAA